MASDAAPALPSRTCWACREELQPDSIFCVKCGNYQNWRRFFLFGNTVLALLIALISVISLSIPTFSSWTAQWSARVVAVWVDVYPEEGIYIWISNNLGHTIAVTDTYLACKGDLEDAFVFQAGTVNVDEAENEQLWYLASERRGLTVLKANSSDLVRYRLREPAIINATSSRFRQSLARQNPAYDDDGRFAMAVRHLFENTECRLGM